MGRLYFGDMVKHPRKIVYAASSAGRLADHPRHKEALSRIAAADFFAISLREKANVDFFRANGFSPALVPDPSLLLSREEWIEIELAPKRSVKNDFVFGYDLGHKGAVSVRNACDMIAAEWNCSIHIPYPKRFWKDRRVACAPGPAEWLWYIHHARLVVTNSFHGVMFSLVFNVPFVYLPIIAEDSSLNMRTFDILNYVGLMNRCLHKTVSLEDEYLRLANATIDWGPINERLSVFRRHGLDYLKGCL